MWLGWPIAHVTDHPKHKHHNLLSWNSLKGNDDCVLASAHDMDTSASRLAAVMMSALSPHYICSMSTDAYEQMCWYVITKTQRCLTHMMIRAESFIIICTLCLCFIRDGIWCCKMMIGWSKCMWSIKCEISHKDWIGLVDISLWNAWCKCGCVFSDVVVRHTCARHQITVCV